MDNRETTIEARRRFITLVGGSALLAPFVGLAGCGDKEEPRAPAMTGDDRSTSEMRPNQSTGTQPATDRASERAAAQEPAGERSPAEAADTQAGAQQAGGNGAMPKLSEDDPQAKSLAYVHNAEDVIASEQPRYEQGQACNNCQLYQGTANDEWAGCPLFAGKQVKGTGWCNAYTPRSG
ncbi:high-potential iron-sulfur protein [Haliea sp. E1-2-M8]|uniref:high-potential iron-sulfur protein n=1 Tax=Haliea sp. E1-2-M8 TaxID=3064706 RepID=UPI0027211618|nr:high-potential iron-sulfur protein [Haliea sp. E1-2-M8]MDO8861014.1 high-potential iron-sulfur protein [Haliea sp. E1-2-M8]